MHHQVWLQKTEPFRRDHQDKVGQMDRQRDRHKHRQGNSSIPPLTVLWGVKKKKKSGQENSMLLWGVYKDSREGNSNAKVFATERHRWMESSQTSINTCHAPQRLCADSRARERGARERNQSTVHSQRSLKAPMLECPPKWRRDFSRLGALLDQRPSAKMIEDRWWRSFCTELGPHVLPFFPSTTASG